MFHDEQTCLNYEALINFMVYMINSIFLKLSKEINKMCNSVYLFFTVSSACPQDRRHSSSSLHELIFLSQLTESALKLEKSIQELFEETFLLLEMPRNAPGTALLFFSVVPCHF